MPLSSASTPHPLPRQRKRGAKRPRLTLAGALAEHAPDETTKSSGLAPAKAIQKDECPSDSRRAHQARIDALRLEIRKLVDAVTLGADIELLDLMRDEIGSFRRHKVAQEARTWASAAGVQLETGLMMLDRALRPTTE